MVSSLTLFSDQGGQHTGEQFQGLMTDYGQAAPVSWRVCFLYGAPLLKCLMSSTQPPCLCSDRGQP
jgi:hypothetical protein